MDMTMIENFFFWCMIINIGIYLLVTVAWLSMRGFYLRMLTKMLDLGEEDIRKGVFTYLANYKLMITVFNFTPWVAIVMLK